MWGCSGVVTHALGGGEDSSGTPFPAPLPPFAEAEGGGDAAEALTAACRD